MAKSSNSSSETKYKKVRVEFDNLDFQNRALFLIDAAMSTVISGVEEFAGAVGDALDDFGSRVRDAASEKADEASGSKSKSKSTRQRTTKQSSTKASKKGTRKSTTKSRKSTKKATTKKRD